MAKDPLFGYTGRGSGIPKILRLCKEQHIPIMFENDLLRQRFNVTIQRRRNAVPQ